MISSHPRVAPLDARLPTPAVASTSLGSLVRQCFGVTIALLLLCCLVYPGVVTGLAQAVFARQANGSLIENRGSSLIGQPFSDPAAWPEYFWGRASASSIDSATGVTVSSGGNEGPLQGSLRDSVAAREKLFRDTGVTGPIPVDMLTKSASGLDPHISPAGAEIQVPRVAKLRGMSEDRVRALVAENTEPSTLGFMGEPRVNVLMLDLALDREKPVPHAPRP